MEQVSLRESLMGCCVTIGKTPEEVELASRSKLIDRQIKNDQRKMQQEVKLLLLGAGESGKSTFLKQMKIIHGVVFEPEHLKEFRKNILQNMIKGMRVLVDAQRKLGITLQHSANRAAGDQVRFHQIDLYYALNYATLCKTSGQCLSVCRCY